jgi:hypothetical protein
MILTATRSAASVLSTIDVDFQMLRHKLMSPDEGEGWSVDRLEIAESEYRKFLALCLAYPDEAIVPCKIVDEFWHAHILDTRAYRADCDRVFGFFYDHFPYFGIKGDDDAADLERAYERTLALYDENFGQPPYNTWRSVDAMKCVRTACKPQKCK